MSAKQQKIVIRIDPRYTAIERKFIAEDIINQIRVRTDSGLGLSGNPDSSGVYSGTTTFPKYSKEYTKSLDFKNSGKAGKVNLNLSGDMLTEIDVIEENEGSITIGFKNGTKENNRAEGNIIGSYGKPKPDAGKARNFLGVTQDELQSILKNYPIESKKNNELLEEISSVDLFDNLDFDILRQD